MKNILVPTDFSKNCNKAAIMAMKMASLFNAEIHFFHQISTPIDWLKLSKIDESKYPEILKKIGNAKNKLKELEKRAESMGLKCRTFLEYVSNEENIVSHSEHFNHDFIITGSKGLNKSLINKLLGSSTQYIIRKSVVPVLMVKQNEVSFPFKDIVFVSDFLEDVRKAFIEVVELANKCNAHIHLLNINTDSDYNSIEKGLESIKAFLKRFPKLKNYSMHVYNESSVLKGITKFNESNSIDLIAICTHSRKGILSIFSKSIAEGVTNHSTIPVMTMHI